MQMLSKTPHQLSEKMYVHPRLLYFVELLQHVTITSTPTLGLYANPTLGQISIHWHATSCILVPLTAQDHGTLHGHLLSSAELAVLQQSHIHGSARDQLFGHAPQLLYTNITVGRSAA